MTALGEFISLPVGGVGFWHAGEKEKKKPFCDKIFNFYFV